MSLSLWNWMHAMQEIVLYVHWPKDKHAEGCSQIKFLRSVLMAFNFFLTEIQHVIKSDNSKGRWISLNHGGGLRAFYPPPVILLRITVLICIFQLACKITGFFTAFLYILGFIRPSLPHNPPLFQFLPFGWSAFGLSVPLLFLVTCLLSYSCLLSKQLSETSPLSFSDYLFNFHVFFLF